MKTVHVVYKEQGEYSDYTMTILAAFSSKNKAEHYKQMMIEENKGRKDYYAPSFSIEELPIDSGLVPSEVQNDD